MADLASLSREELVELVISLQQQVEELWRTGNRQTAPFSKGNQWRIRSRRAVNLDKGFFFTARRRLGKQRKPSSSQSRKAVLILAEKWKRNE